MTVLPPYAVTNSALPVRVPFEQRNYHRQGFEVPNTSKPGQTGHYRNALFPELVTVESNPGFPKTTYECFNHGLGRSADKPCLGWRPLDLKTGDFEKRYVWQTYLEVDTRRTHFGSGLVQIQREGLVSSNEPTSWRLGIWCQNRPEWQIAAQACAAYNFATVGLYDTLGPNTVEYCINHSEICVVVASAAHLPDLFSLASKCPTMTVIISADPWEEIDGLIRNKSTSSVANSTVLKKWAKSVGIYLFDFKEVEAMGAAKPCPHNPPKPDDLASFNYTSGTTGNPKAAFFKHRTMAAAATFALHNFHLDGDSDVFISWLPCAHVYERFLEDLTFVSGAPMGYSCGDNLRLLEDLKLLKPTRFAAVPRVLNRIYQAIQAQMAAPGLKGALARRALDAKMYNLKHSKTFEHALWDRIVFNKTRSAMGGNIKLIGSGSAPISPEVLDFLKIVFVTEVTEGYGSTENSGICTRVWNGDHEPNGTVGPPQAGQEIKLVDVPEMGYFATDKPYPRGEICVRGEACIVGYYKDDAKTKELIDSDGWQHSGDIGLIDEKGRLKIIDRIKSLLKLAQGEYVALEKIEGIYSLCPIAAQVYLHGDSLESHLIAVVVPEPNAFAAFVSKVIGKSISPADTEALVQACQDEQVIKASLIELNKEAQKAKLHGFETAKQLHLTMELFSVENDLLTPTQKLKRPQARKYFQDVMVKLYSQYQDLKPKL